MGCIPYFLHNKNQSKGVLIILKTIEEAEIYFGKDKTIRLVNFKQVIFYAELGCQPVFVGGGLDKKFVALYMKKDTLDAWRLWKESNPNKQ